MRPLSELLVPGIGRAVLLCWSRMPRAQGMAAYVRDGYGALSQPKFECGFGEMIVFGFCGVRQNWYLQSWPQSWPRWLEFWLFTNINGFREDWGCACLFPFCGLVDRPSSGEVGFYKHKSSWCCILWLRKSKYEKDGCWLEPCKYLNTWHLDGCSWSSTGRCCIPHR